MFNFKNHLFKPIFTNNDEEVINELSLPFVMCKLQVRPSSTGSGIVHNDGRPISAKSAVKFGHILRKFSNSGDDRIIKTLINRANTHEKRRNFWFKQAMLADTIEDANSYIDTGNAIQLYENPDAISHSGDMHAATHLPGPWRDSRIRNARETYNTRYLGEVPATNISNYWKKKR